MFTNVKITQAITGTGAASWPAGEILTSITWQLISTIASSLSSGDIRGTLLLGIEVDGNINDIKNGAFGSYGVLSGTLS